MKQLKQPTVGDRVQFATRWLRSTGQFTGDPAPCSWGPFARGQLVKVEPLGQCDLAQVRFDNGDLKQVLLSNLEAVK